MNSAVRIDMTSATVDAKQQIKLKNNLASAFTIPLNVSYKHEGR